MSRTLDFLPNHQEIKLYQDDEMFRINTDTMVLGEFIEVYRKDTVLDFGTNNGALLLYANLFSPKKLIGLDINDKALELAKENLELNKITNYQLIHTDGITYQGDEVDVIICNPPYFKTNINEKCLNPYLALAKHEDYLRLDNLIPAIARNLKTNGKLFLLFQTSRMFEVFNTLEKFHFNVKRIKFVYDKQKAFSNVFLIKAVKGGQKGVEVEKPIIIER